MARSLKTLNLEDFDIALWKHCNKIEKGLPNNYAKTPEKYNERHFGWLVDYQVPPCKEFKEIAEGIEERSRPSVDTIRKGVKGLGKTLGITLRKPKYRGRPKGIIETKKRSRAKK